MTMLRAMMGDWFPKGLKSSKFHRPVHYEQEVLTFGTLAQFTLTVFEQAHKDLIKKFIHLVTNAQDITKQITDKVNKLNT